MTTNCVHIRSGLLNETFSEWQPILGPENRQIAIITDTNVASLHASSLAVKLRSNDYNIRTFTFPAGEKNKTRETVYSLQDQILDRGINRNTAIIGIGGGVTTDIAGYIAASLLRGLEFISIPTTLLAMVDASIGGKTGVNTRHGKNLIGAFYPATSVLIDPVVLETLQKKQLVEGVVEMIKHGAIADANHFQQLVDDAEKVLELNEKTIESAITKSCAIKATVVAEDQQEQKGKRSILNFGHTIGHALELASNYTISHGEAVAIGMVAEAELAVRMGILSSDARQSLVEALKMYNIETVLPVEFPKETLLQAMKYDKKNRNEQPRFVLLEKIGACAPCNGAYCSEVKPEILDALFIN
jgi:3-dehydroquinate synthase